MIESFAPDRLGRAILATTLFGAPFFLHAIAGASDAPPASSPAARLIAQPGPLVIAHRGFSQQAPENTLPAFRLALAARADLIELDYYHAQDGVPVVIHDGTLDRTTDATNRWGGKGIAVTSRNASELTSLDAGRWFSPAYAGTRLPTLVESIETIQAGGVTLIERKGGDAPALARLLRERGWINDLVVQSFDWGFVRDARRAAPDLVLGALGPPSSRNGRKLADQEKVLGPEFIADIEQLGAQLVVWNRQVTADAIAHAHQRGLRVWVYTINDPNEAAQIVRLGVDGIITDNPAVIRARLHPQADDSADAPSTRAIPKPLPEHPGNIYLEGETVQVRLPEGLPDTATGWRLLDDQARVLRSGALSAQAVQARTPIAAGDLGVGWYRIEFDAPERTNILWTTAAVIRRLSAPVPGDSPVCVDSATAWFARNDPPRQERFANLAALAGVNWVRDRLRWSDIQPEPGALVPAGTTYDTAAEAQHAAGLKVLQVFHDTPSWAREVPNAGGRFAPDLRHAYDLGRALAARFKGRVAAWEPWNEANVSTFGAHTVDEMCSWQKASWLGFKAGDPGVIVGWNVTTTAPTPAQTDGVLANETWPYFDTYNIHTYDWSHSYAQLWKPAREAVSGRPLWVTEADRGTPHLKQDPWYDQDPQLERLKAEWLAQSYASSLFAGTRRHFHFILGHYHEPNGVQFGLLRLDMTPRPAYAALAAVGRCLAGARALGRFEPGEDVHVYAFRAKPDGQERDVLVAWAEKEMDWDGRGQTASAWKPPVNLDVQGVVDYLGRPAGTALPERFTSAPVFVFLPAGQAATLPLEPPPPLAHPRTATVSPVVLQLSLPRSATARVQDIPWSEGYVYSVKPGQSLTLPIHAYNFGTADAKGRIQVERQPEGWEVQVPSTEMVVGPRDRVALEARLRVPAGAACRDGWVVLRADCADQGRPVLAFRVLAKDE
ncbi:MAG TPA: glycerophosphodiester phosphodiesterase family protein [Verrucomicrobiota bacterium]|nr:glycerophosphodiester phosphodiesterase family protein [Verrucomicrobiota bacterium]